MFSRNRFNGQHGAGVTPPGGAKPKVHLPKKRAPNPKVALVIRGKIHRLLQGSAEHRAPDSHLHHTATEEEEEREAHGCSKEHRRMRPKAGLRLEALKVPTRNPLSVGEVELNRGGCMKIPCTLRRSSRGPAQAKHISFESGLRDAPEQMPLYSPDQNGNKLPARKDLSSPPGRPKRPHSAGGCLDSSFNRTPPQTGFEEDADREAASSAIIQHILKELRGINKIQEEISDLRDYLTLVRGSVEEVSSCVDAVLLEIEGFRSSSKANSVTSVDSWSEMGRQDGSSPRRRPVSADSTLGRAVPNIDVNGFPVVASQRHSIHGEIRAEELAVYQLTSCLPAQQSVVQQELEEQDDASEQSSDVPDGYLTGKLSSRYLEEQDGQDCPSLSSLSSGHSSKSESDLNRLLFCHERKHHGAGDEEERWSNVLPPYSIHKDPAWQEALLREKSLNGSDGRSGHSFEGAGSREHSRDARAPSMGSSEHLPTRSGKHSHCPSRKEERSPPLRQSQARPHDPTNLQNCVGYECGADLSLPQSSGYHSATGRSSDAEDSDLQQTMDLSYPTSCDTYSASEETWTTNNVDGPLFQKPEILNQNCGDQLRFCGAEGTPAGGFTVKRFGRAVLGFSSALRGAFRKLEVSPAVNSEERTDFDIPAEKPLEPFGFEDHKPSDEAHGHTSEKPKENGMSHGITGILCVQSLSEDTKNLLSSESTEDHLGPNRIPAEDPAGSTKKQVPEEQPAGVPNQLSQCTTAESLSASLFAHESSDLEEAGLTELWSTTNTVVEGKEAGGPVEEHSLKCLRSFQQVLRKKKETKCELPGRSMSTSSQNDLETGSAETKLMLALRSTAALSVRLL